MVATLGSADPGANCLGSDNVENQTVHWKNVVPDIDAFRQGLFSRLNVSAEQWKAYWDHLKQYRDQSVAHHDQRRVEIKTYPKLDLALLSAYFYYETVLAELLKLGIEQFPKDRRLSSTLCRPSWPRRRMVGRTMERSFTPVYW
jgi:hypothetical protein